MDDLDTVISLLIKKLPQKIFSNTNLWASNSTVLPDACVCSIRSSVVTDVTVLSTVTTKLYRRLIHLSTQIMYIDLQFYIVYKIVFIIASPTKIQAT